METFLTFLSVIFILGIISIIVGIICLGIYTFGNNKWKGYVDYILFHKEYMEKYEIDKKHKILKNGTKEEKIELLNKDNPDYQMMTDSELKEKYKGLDFNKVIIVDSPLFTYNIVDKKVPISEHDLYEVIQNYHTKNYELRMKSGNRSLCVDTWEWEDLSFINDLNNYEKIAIYRHDCGPLQYRYKILDNIT